MSNELIMLMKIAKHFTNKIKQENIKNIFKSSSIIIRKGITFCDPVQSNQTLIALEKHQKSQRKEDAMSKRPIAFKL